MKYANLFLCAVCSHILYSFDRPSTLTHALPHLIIRTAFDTSTCATPNTFVMGQTDWNVSQMLLNGSWVNPNKCTRLVLISTINPSNPELNPICYLLALLGAHHFLHVSRRRVKSLTFRLLISYIYIYIYIYI